MTIRRSLKRRDFLKGSAAALAVGLTGRFSGRAHAAGAESIEAAAAKVGRLPRRKLGYSGREVSVLIGAGDMPSPVLHAALLCGMNYWHKADRWDKDEVPRAILKDREAHYCQVCVDRVGGRQESGRMDEEAHYAYVKESLQKTGLRYYDDMELHFGYHNAAEVKNERGFVRAFERLKKEGLVKYLCLSQHGYAGNSRIPGGGQGAAEVLTAVVEDGLYEHAQFMFSYGADPALSAFLELARRKGFGTIAMKTARGLGRMKDDKAFIGSLPEGVAPHNALTRWLTTVAGIDAAVIRVGNLEEFVETYSGAGRGLREADARAIEMMTARADRTACRLCTECQPHCPRQLPIADILRFERYAVDDRDLSKARTLYAGLDLRADACDACGDCLGHCPQRLAIPEKLAAAHSLLG